MRWRQHRQKGNLNLGPSLAWSLVAISSCLLAQSVAVTSLSTYIGVYVQQLVGLASADMAGEEMSKGVVDELLACMIRKLASHYSLDFRDCCCRSCCLTEVLL